MSYLKKRYREMMEEMDKKNKLPNDWRKFIEKKQKENNLIIKKKGICTCTYCNKKFKSNKKVNQYVKCPNCKNKYLIKSGRLTWHYFEPTTLTLLDKLKDRWIIRLFELQSSYSKTKNGVGTIWHREVAEYGRIILDEGITLVNDRLYNVPFSGYRVATYKNIKKWRVFENDYYYISAEGYLYPNNLKKLMKGTEYQYSQLWKLARKEKIDIQHYLKNNYKSTELLIKMGLYKLALYPEDFEKSGNFIERFGVDKSYYNFMKKHNIDINELEILKIYKKKNINKIRYLKEAKKNDLMKISQFMSLDKFINYTKKYKTFDIKLYIDYLGFIKDLQLDIKNKKYLFPKNLKEEHDKCEKQIKLHKSQILRRKIKERYDNLKDNTFKNKKYIVFPAKSVNELEDESKQQSNCVRTYAEEYANGECDIYFMRENKDIKKSLVTVEVNENEIVQSRAKYNKGTTKEQDRFLRKWENDVLKVA